MLKHMVTDDSLPQRLSELSLLCNPQVVKVTKQLDREIEQLAHPDLAWRWNNHRPKITEDMASGLRRARTASPFACTENQRDFVLPIEHWEAIAKGIRIRFRKSASEKPPGHPRDMDWQKWIHHRVTRLSQMGWSLELIATRFPFQHSDKLPPDLSPDVDLWVMRMDCRSWFDLFLRSAQLAQWSLDGEECDLARHGALTLRTQCHPDNERYLLMAEAFYHEQSRPIL